MTASNAAPAPKLPFSIFRASQKVERYLLYDITIITWLREFHNILGVLIGTLPQAPQQNVFLGLPLELQPEEARFVVEKGLAFVARDRNLHVKELASKNATEVQAIRSELLRRGTELAKNSERRKQIETDKAFKKIQNKKDRSGGEEASLSNALTMEDDVPAENLFSNSSTRDAIPTLPPPPSRTPLLGSRPFSITPTVSYPPLSLPHDPTESELPNATPASYELFKHLHNLGYFLSPGIRFGCQFSVYPGDPLRFHSHFLAMSYEWDEDIDLLDLVGGGRLSTGVKKSWLIGGVEEPKSSVTDVDEVKHGKAAANDSTKVRTFCIEWGGM